MTDISKWVPLPLPPVGPRYEWTSRVWDNDGHPCAEFTLLRRRGRKGVSRARIDLDLYGFAGVKERALAMVTKAAAEDAA